MAQARRIGVIAVLATCLTVVAAASAAPPDLAQSYLFTPAGRLTPLHAGSTYQATLFPLALRLTPPDGSWSAAQWMSGTDYFRGGGPPHFAWVHLGQGPASGIPQGLVSIMTADARTPSVAATVALLRSRGHGASYDAAKPVELSGFQGIQFDGRIVGAKNRDHVGHVFIPFSPRSNAAKYYPDEYQVYGDVFRVIVLDVRGKTVLVYIDSGPLRADQFPALLTKADRILRSVRFPAG